MEEKLKALKTLGFNYITRDMDGVLCAWFVKPQRFIYCSEDRIDEAKEIYGKDAIINYFFTETESDSRYIISCCSFVFPRKEDCKHLWDYGRFQLYDPKNEFSQITWENSPFNIP